jgi:hypothetical protein
MRLFELFDSGGHMMEKMRQSVMDTITPLLSQDVPFITVQVIDSLRHVNLGVSVDRSLVMQILDPNEVKSIDKIEGDRIYLANPDGPSHEVSDNDAEKEQEHVGDMAQNQAKKNMNGQQPSIPTSPQNS